MLTQLKCVSSLAAVFATRQCFLQAVAAGSKATVVGQRTPHMAAQCVPALFFRLPFVTQAQRTRVVAPAAAYDGSVWVKP